MRTYRPQTEPAKLSHSAPPSPSDGHRATGPGVPITSGPSSFRPGFLALWLGVFAAVWLLGASGCSMLDI